MIIDGCADVGSIGTGSRPRTPGYFCFGKSSQNHFDRGMALRVPCAVHRPRSGQTRWTARLFPGPVALLGQATRPGMPQKIQGRWILDDECWMTEWEG
jgi:hypothetical protein